MKRHGNLWDNMISFASLLRAAHRARRRKRYRPGVARFFFQLEPQLWQLHQELAERTYEPGEYQTFYVYEPKKRLISAAPFRDRVVQHVLTGTLEPIFEPCFIQDSYACRRGKGTHAAVRRAQQYARQFRYVLKADIRKFFPSLDHQILKDLLARKIKDPGVLWLAAKIIDGSNPQEPVLHWFPGDDLFTASERQRGIPIGNQTSQFFANAYLSPLDHFVKDRLGVRGYVRYVDDFLVFGNDKVALADVRGRVAQFLVGLRLQLHPDKTVISAIGDGVRFLGYRVFPTHRLLPKENIRRFRRRVRQLQAHYADGRIGPGDVRQRLMSWTGHARRADTYLLCERLFATIGFRRARAE